ncbi:hypothetical protein [Salinisphaera orenii]|uniref:hypothetical protein n=1 Tax=Salinisphaera orenii TaxID=856731 RepID=UPI0019550A7D
MTSPETTTDEPSSVELAKRVRAACIQAARYGYEDAAMAGLCGEGALEAVIGTIEKLDVEALLAAPDDATQNFHERTTTRTPTKRSGFK